MTREHWRRAGHWTAAAIVVTIGLACTPPAGGHENTASAATATATQDATRIEHVTPARDSTGPAPSAFKWTPVEGADRYAIGVWSEVDRLMWRQDDVPTASIERPEELQLEPGTYFWSVSAIRGNQQIAESGLAAFVVFE